MLVQLTDATLLWWTRFLQLAHQNDHTADNQHCPEHVGLGDPLYAFEKEMTESYGDQRSGGDERGNDGGGNILIRRKEGKYAQG